MRILTALKAEQMKHRHRKLLLLPVILLLFEFIWAVWSLDPKKPSDLVQGYLSSFYLFPIINSLIYPIFLAVLTNRICDMEIKGDTLKLLYTLEDKKTFYNCKYFMALKYIVLTSAGTCLIPWIVGKMYRFTASAGSLHLCGQHGSSEHPAAVVPVVFQSDSAFGRGTGRIIFISVFHVFSAGRRKTRPLGLLRNLWICRHGLGALHENHHLL